MRSRQPRALTEHFPNRSTNYRSTPVQTYSAADRTVRLRANSGPSPRSR
jgi:hypothetical protein